jgi:hypothetical protein
MQTDAPLSPVVVPQEFAVRVFYGKPSNLWVVLGGMLMLCILGRLSAYLDLPAMLGDDGAAVPGIGLVVLAFIGLWRYLRQQVVDCTATVTADQLVIAAPGAEVLTSVPFAKVTTFRYMEAKGVHWLLFTMRNGQQIKLAGNSNLGAIGAFDEMVHAVVQVARNQWQHLPATMKQYKGWL